MISDELKALIEMIEHNTIVQSHLLDLASTLNARAKRHDVSKFSMDEFESFIELKKIARTYPYGSAEYDKSMEGNKAISLHFSRNSHHPEHYTDGISGMSLIDFIEMVCDWKATNEVRKQKQDTAISWEDSLEVQRKRFSMDEIELRLVNWIAKELE